MHFPRFTPPSFPALAYFSSFPPIFVVFCPCSVPKISTLTRCGLLPCAVSACYPPPSLFTLPFCVSRLLPCCCVRHWLNNCAQINRYQYRYQHQTECALSNYKLDEIRNERYLFLATFRQLRVMCIWMIDEGNTLCGKTKIISNSSKTLKGGSWAS